MTTIIIGRELLEQALGQLICNTNNMQKGMSKSIQKLCARENAEVLERLRTALAAPATAPAWHDAQQAEIESLRWTVKDALESLDNGMTADCRATLSSATKETP